MPTAKESDEFLILIKKISARPGMYVGDRGFLAASAFIDGFIYSREYQDPEEMSTLREFSHWISEKLDRPKNWSWSTVMIDFYKDGEKALEMLPRHFEEFHNSRQ